MSKYSGIIDLPHHRSENHSPMPPLSRAAQFAPFAALTGFDAEIGETARLTDTRLSLSAEQNDNLNDTIAFLISRIKQRPLVSITFFVPDLKKSGGRYETVSGNARVIDEVNRTIILTDGKTIEMDMIFSIEVIGS